MLQDLSWFPRLLVSLPKHVRLLGDNPANIVNLLYYSYEDDQSCVEWMKKSVRPQAKSSGVATHERTHSTGTERSRTLARIISNLLLNSQVKPERSAYIIVTLYIQHNVVRLFGTMILVITLMYIPCSMLKNKVIFS